MHRLSGGYLTPPCRTTELRRNRNRRSVSSLAISYAMATIDPAHLLSVRVGEASRITGIGRTKLYELIKVGGLETVKIGRATLITMRSLRRLIEQ